MRAVETILFLVVLGTVVAAFAGRLSIPAPSLLVIAGPGSTNMLTGRPRRNTTFMTWNLLHLARMLKDAGGIPAHGNQRSGWDAGCRYDFDNPEYR